MWIAQAGNDTLDLAQWIARAGPSAILAFVIVGFLKGWIVTGRAFDQMRQERDRAVDLVYKQAGIAERAVDISVQRLEIEEQLLDRLKRERDGFSS